MLASLPRPAARALLDGVVTLRWARLGSLDLAAPLAMALVAIHYLPGLGERVLGVPFWAVAALSAAGVLAAGAVAERAVRRASATARAALGLQRLLVAEVLGLWIAADLAYVTGQGVLYDFEVYLGAAGRWAAGGQPYLTAPIAHWPAAPSQDYFLYPPPLLAFFAALGALPHAAAVAGWLALLVAASYGAFRLLGLGRVASLGMLAFPPLVVGIASGNVASLLFLSLAAGFRSAAALIPSLLCKVQSALPALWPVRERRWRELAIGTAVTAVIVAVTLPLTGLAAWRDWAASLGYRAASQAAIPPMFGFSPAFYLPGPVYAGMAAALALAALRLRDHRALAALGLAAVWASPSLWPHGFLLAVPALLLLRDATALWLLLGAGAAGPALWYLFYGGWLAVLAAPDEPLTGTASPT